MFFTYIYLYCCVFYSYRVELYLVYQFHSLCIIAHNYCFLYLVIIIDMIYAHNMLAESLVHDNCFREIFENANPRKLCRYIIIRYTGIIIYPYSAWTCTIYKFYAL